MPSDVKCSLFFLVFVTGTFYDVFGCAWLCSVLYDLEGLGFEVQGFGILGLPI